MPDHVRSFHVDALIAGIGVGGRVDLPAAGTVSAVGVPTVHSDDGPRPAEGVPPSLIVDGTAVATALPAGAARRAFAAKPGETFVRTTDDGVAVVHIGMGPSGPVALDVVRRAAAAFVRQAGRQGTGVLLLPAALVADTVLAEAPVTQAEAVQAAVEGAVLASYRFVAHKSDPVDERLESVVIATDLDEAAAEEGFRRGRAVSEAVCFARDLVNEPPSTMTPVRLAAAADAHLAARPGVTLEVWEEQRIEAEHLGGLLGVARGSAEPPRLLRVLYGPPPSANGGGRVPHVVLVGKGITFDSGGLSLKSPEGMTTMKTDMSGAAAVVAAAGACADLGVPVKVTAIAPVTENMPGGRAVKPGDVLTARDGQTIEVLNTDAEGRLVLADGLSLAAELEPDAVVDLATLTGACVVALGREIAGMFANDGSLMERVRRASERAGEPVWPLPLPASYRPQIDSEVADVKNVGKPGQAGAIAAASLLARFVREVPWVHLDIAGPARSDEEDGPVTKGGTGFGVRTLIELVSRYVTEPAPPASRLAP